MHVDKQHETSLHLCMPNLCPGNEEFQYKKPFADATFLVCETQTV